MTIADLIKTMLIRRHMKSIDLCKKLNCSQQALSNKMNRSTWKLSTFLDIVKACNGELIIKLPDKTELKVESGEEAKAKKTKHVHSKTVPTSNSPSVNMPRQKAHKTSHGHKDKQINGQLNFLDPSYPDNTH